MTTVGAFEAKTHLSALLDRVERGEEVTITRHGRPVARLVPAHETDPVAAAATIGRIASRRAALQRESGTFSLDEILALRDEGRP
ncbi:MAG TPA: type II toxin-antitoxin system prevent-host-death family antitoxin [Microvirga sp.]|jgi:prevent-host-death family protein|nr:type II toxin-antitoxin system prevent-host-death family antitoxin [Microvirga sp.]